MRELNFAAPKPKLREVDVPGWPLSVDSDLDKAANSVLALASKGEFVYLHRPEYKRNEYDIFYYQDGELRWGFGDLDDYDVIDERYVSTTLARLLQTLDEKTQVPLYVQ